MDWYSFINRRTQNIPLCWTSLKWTDPTRLWSRWSEPIRHTVFLFLHRLANLHFHIFSRSPDYPLKQAPFYRPQGPLRCRHSLTFSNFRNRLYCEPTSWETTNPRRIRRFSTKSTNWTILAPSTENQSLERPNDADHYVLSPPCQDGRS